MDIFDLPARPVKGPERVLRTPKAIVDDKPYERRETRCILTIGKRFLRGYDESYITSVGRDVSRGFSSTFTFVYGPLLTPEIRITHQFVQESRNEHDDHAVHSRITVPINAIEKSVAYGPTTLRGHHALYLRLNTDLSKVIVSRTSETPIDARLAADGESFVQLVREPKSIQLNILVSPHTAIVEELVNAIKSDFMSLKSREIEPNENRHHGFTPDGTHQKYLVVMAVDHDCKGLLPSIDEPCTLHFGDTVRTILRGDSEGYTTEGWQATRTPPPRGAPSHFIYFIADVPRQFDKSSNSETVPVSVILPPSAANIPIGRITGNKGDRIKMRHQVIIRLSTSPATTQMEMDAVKKMSRAAQQGSSKQAMRWAYAQKFSMDGVENIDIHEAFPAIAKLSFNSGFDAPQSKLFDSLKKAPAGIAMFTGGPGSGKSTFAAIIAAAVATHSRHGRRDRVVWIVFSNDLCDDAVRRIQEQCGSKARVGRLPTWSNLVDSLADLRMSKTNSTTAAKVQRVARHVGCVFGGKRGDESADPKSSVTASAIDIAKHDTFFWEHKIGSTHWRDTCRAIISLAMDQFHVLVATPFAVGQLGNHVNPELQSSGPNACPPWTPSMAIIDEAGRIPEAQWWIPLAAFPDAIVLTMGDTKQFKPLSVSFNAIIDQGHDRGPEPKWNCVFGKQRTLSILRRAEMCGQILGHLSSNRRNRGDIAEWARANSYRGQMQILYPLRESPDARTYTRFLRWVFESKASDTNSVIFDIRRSVSERHGTGYLNDASRNFTLWLIYQAFRYRLPNLTSPGKLADIMIITPYSSQVHAYKLDIEGLADSGIIKNKVAVRTIDNSMSTEADIVIFDVVRTLDISGFINDRRRMTVASTRARGAAVMVLNSIGLTASRSHEEGDGSFNSYARLHADRKRVVVDHQDWDVICKKCNKPGDQAAHVCNAASRTCRICGSGDHHERFCEEGKPALDEYTVSAEEDAVRFRLNRLF
ncbi:ppar-alpha interacting complex protein 285 [Colletotrichum plurivorum]|uniref:Ppar-alpha interacting complex protein 285 n=1 Tax=Colletotrichum plurivorum TaxID=2175906 RepID=A0A8H6NLW9_9PEZI|nr:ppar-alpha interacting complex protein 285 [Colletotrichum plurivorum]